MSGTQIESVTPVSDLGAKKRDPLIAAINRWYDWRMFQNSRNRRLIANEFTNYGYWTHYTRTQKEACEQLMEELLALIPLEEGTILDVACGKGATTRYLLNYYSPEKVVGINISQRQLARCKVNAPHSRFLLMSATELGFQDDSFDNIICVEAAFHFNTREQFLREAHRVLKPGGCLVLSDILMTKIVHASKIANSHNQVRQLNYIIDLDHYRNLYVRAGFQHINVLDATKECWMQYYRHALSFWRWCFARRETDWPTFRREMDLLFRRRQNIRYYVLAFAQKA